MSLPFLENINKIIAHLERISATYGNFITLLDEALAVHFNEQMYSFSELSIDFIAKMALECVVQTLRNRGGFTWVLPNLGFIQVVNNFPRATYRHIIQRLAQRGTRTYYHAFLDILRDYKLSAQVSSTPMTGGGPSHQTPPGSFVPPPSTLAQPGYPSMQQSGFADIATPVPAAAGYTIQAAGQVVGQPGQQQTGHLQEHMTTAPAKNAGLTGKAGFQSARKEPSSLYACTQHEYSGMPKKMANPGSQSQSLRQLQEEATDHSAAPPATQTIKSGSAPAMPFHEDMVTWRKNFRTSFMIASQSTRDKYSTILTRVWEMLGSLMEKAEAMTLSAIMESYPTSPPVTAEFYISRMAMFVWSVFREASGFGVRDGESFENQVSKPEGFQGIAAHEPGKGPSPEHQRALEEALEKYNNNNNNNNIHTMNQQHTIELSASFDGVLQLIKYSDMRDEYRDGRFIAQMLFSRPRRPGAAIPHNRISKWDDAGEHERFGYETKYCHSCRGLDAYITLLRGQIGMGLKLENMLEPENQADRCQKLWRLLHHDFGNDAESDMKVKGYILHLLTGEKYGEVFPVKPTLEGLLLAQDAPELAVKLYFHHSEAALFSPETQVEFEDESGQQDYKPVNLLETGWTPTNLTRFVWNGDNTPSEFLSNILARSLSMKSTLIPIFHKPLFVTIHLEYDKESATGEKAIEDLRYLNVKGLCPGDEVFRKEVINYHLFAVANLTYDDVRLYTPDTEPIVETNIRTKPGTYPPIMDNGVWKVGERESSYLLVYRQWVGEGFESRNMSKDIPEFISPNEHEMQYHDVPGCRPNLHIDEEAKDFEEDEPAVESD